MSVKIRNALLPSQERHRVEHAVRDALGGGRGEFEAVITHAVDPSHAEVLILERGQRRAAYFADLRRTAEELSTAIRGAMRESQR